jgi:hypothetical protein
MFIAITTEVGQTWPKSGQVAALIPNEAASSSASYWLLSLSESMM